MTEDQQRHGCDRCWPDSADQAWQLLSKLPIEQKLEDESHFTVKIRCCPACTQRFVSVFTEQIDWSDGEDPQYWTVMPISQAEAQGLAAAGSSIESALNTLAPRRRALLRNCPKGSEPHSFWGTGILVGPHD